MKKIILAILGAGLLLGSCWDYRTFYTRSYVCGYYRMSQMKLLVRNNAIYLNADKPKFIGDVNSTNKAKDNFDRICNFYGDTYYNRELKIDPALPVLPNVYLANSYVSLKIISDADFDETHPAGTSLADIVRFVSASPMPYIRSGYKNTFTWDNDLNKLSESYQTMYEGGIFINKRLAKPSLFPVDKMVIDLLPDDLQLLGNGESPNYIGRLYFESRPAVSKPHNITVTLTDTEGKVFKETVLMEF